MDAKETIRAELDRLFASAPRNRASFELQEELLANCMERYSDLTRGGMEQNAAIQMVISNLGNVDELIAALPGDDGFARAEWEDERRQRSAVTTTIAVGLYILAGVVFFISIFISAIAYEPALLIGLAVAAALCIAPTCMLVYNAYRYPKYEKKEDTVVEDFREWQNDSKKAKSLRKSISSLIWTLTLVLYFLISFTTFAWHITWVIFLIAACLEAIVGIFFSMKGIQ